MKKALAMLAAAAVVGAGVWAYLVTRQDTESDNLTLYGNIDIRDIDLSFNERERIAAVDVEEGDEVEQGDVLARLQKDRLLAIVSETEARIGQQTNILRRLENGTRPEAIEQAKADVSIAEARLENARQKLDRLRKTSASGATSEQARDDAEAEVRAAEAVLKARRMALALAEKGPREEDIAAARAALNALRAQLRHSRIRLRDADLIAPTNGVVRSRILEPGEMAVPGLPVLTLAPTDPKWVRAYVPEPELGRVRPGMAATVFSDTYPDKTYQGWIGYVSPVAEFTPKSVQTEELRTKLVYETRVHVNDPDNELRLGMPVTVVLKLD